MAAIAARYPMIDQIDVLNENMAINTWNKQEHQAGTPYFRAGMGGPGVTGYDWAIWLFTKARHYFPNAKLMVNDFELETNNAGLNEILALVKVLRDRGLIDGFGTQAHYFNIDGIATGTLQTALNNMAKSGLPVYVTELDMKGKTVSEAGQLTSYKNAFPVYWNHPAVAGITLWGYVEGSTWATNTGILNSNGTIRSAMTWLESFAVALPDVGYPFGDGTVTAITATELQQSTIVYPNPVTSGKITVENRTSENIEVIFIFDLQGRVVKTVMVDSQKSEINVTDLQKGIYNVSIRTGKSIESRKIVIL
jgi:hypothetical protein